jgi:hypothetical protein
MPKWELSLGCKGGSIYKSQSIQYITIIEKSRVGGKNQSDTETAFQKS